MKSSIFLAATSAALALANPLDKRVVETDVVVDYFTVTVTGQPPKATPTQAETTQAATTQAAPAENEPSNVKAKPFTNQPPAEQPAPTSQPAVVVVVTATANAAPHTTAASKPTSVVDTPAGPTAGSFQSEALYHHNIHRSNHSSPELTWNEQIAGWAGNTAKTCVFAHDMNQGDGHYGQNIALWGVSSGAQELGETGAIKMAATNMWYDGEFNAFLPSYYGEATPDMSNFEAWGHLSQMVWAGSTTVGCSVQFCPKGTAYSTLDAWFSVCNYSPPGNVGGAYGKNINRPKGDASVSV
ncbi:CAP domain-containing protein [Xylaria intraflava]|nr:CAP domain-containing protein [Xylaria intraflava]